MFWVALASLIMMLSGDGDDVRDVERFLSALDRAVTQVIAEPARRDDVRRAVRTYTLLFEGHRARLNELAKCIEKADRDYAASAAAYAACQEPFDAHWRLLERDLDRNRALLQSKLSEAEAERVAKALERDPDSSEWIGRARTGTERDPAPEPPARRRGLEGVMAQRHMTVPRNSIALLFGPGLPQTFGQRFAAGAVEAGLSYSSVGPQAVGVDQQWMFRGGVVFGLFDDFEAGALFMPIEISPNPHFDDITVLLTERFRVLEKLDLAARFSFRTPANVGWALNPGLSARYHWTPRLALDGAVYFPVELGSRSNPQAPLIALNVPLRASYNLTPALFVLAETGFAADDLSRGSSAVLPMGAGAGWSLLWGKKLVDLTATFDWLGLLHFAPAAGQSAADAGSYRISAGVTLHSQVL
jgi:hypothetical protein